MKHSITFFVAAVALTAVSITTAISTSPFVSPANACVEECREIFDNTEKDNRDVDTGNAILDAVERAKNTGNAVRECVSTCFDNFTGNDN